MAESAGDYGSKITFERHMEERLKSAIIEVTGSDKIIVVVNADLDTSGRPKASSQYKGQVTQKEDTNALVLPGVPAKKEIGKSPTQTTELNLPESSSSLGSFTVRRLVVTILLDKSISASMIDVVRDVATSILDINQNRGDRLDIKQININKTDFRFWSFFYPPHLYWLILIITGAVFLIAASLFLLNPFIKLSGTSQNVKIDVAKETASGGAGGILLQGIETTGTAIKAVGSSVMEEKEQVDKTTLPFSFVKERHIRDLAFLLNKEPLLDIAIVANYLDVDLAARFLDYFTEEKQAEIAFYLSRIEEVSRERIKLLEDKIKERLDYLIGGEEKVANILDLVSDEIRDRVFSLVEKRDADTAKRLRQKVMDLESFMRELSLQGIQVIYRQVDHTLFAQILKSLPDDIQQKVMGALTAGGAELLKQEMDLSRPLFPARLKKEKHNMLLIIRRLIKEGLLEVENN